MNPIPPLTLRPLKHLEKMREASSKANCALDEALEILKRQTLLVKPYSTGDLLDLKNELIERRESLERIEESFNAYMTPCLKEKRELQEKLKAAEEALHSTGENEQPLIQARDNCKEALADCKKK